MEQCGDLRGQGIACKRTYGKQPAPRVTQEPAIALPPENIRRADEEGTVDVQQDNGIAPGIFVSARAVGMFEENFAGAGLEFLNIFRTVVEDKLERHECLEGLGIRFAEPGTAGILRLQNLDGAFSSLPDNQAERIRFATIEGLKPCGGETILRIRGARKQCEAKRGQRGSREAKARETHPALPPRRNHHGPFTGERFAAATPTGAPSERRTQSGSFTNT